MNNDDRITRYLADQADTITLTPADAGAAARRGSRRRTRRRGALVASVTALALVAGSVVVRDGGRADLDADLAAAVVPSNLDWTVVSPQVGLGYDRTTAAVGGSLYSLSSAPGPYVEGANDYSAHLYRSDDGAEWAEIAGPAGMSASSLAASGDTLYAMGTAPAGGGGIDLVVATSTDGAATWATVTLPADIAALQAEYPDQIFVSTPSVASVDGSQVVASVVVRARPDLSHIPELEDDNAYYEFTDTGVITYAVDDAVERSDGSGADNGVVEPDDPEAAPPALETQERMAAGERSREETGRYTWDELGVDPALQALIDGRTFVYVADDGQSFERVELPAGLDGTGDGVSLVASDDGYRLVTETWNDSSGEMSILRSADGHAWEQAASIPGIKTAAGVLGGRAAIAVETGVASDVWWEQADGTWAPLGLTDALDEVAGVHEVAFGPLGVAAVVITGDYDGETQRHLVHSADGSTVSAVQLDDLIADTAASSVVGVSLTADAILVRLGTARTGDDPSPVPIQEVLVGTPR